MNVSRAAVEKGAQKAGSGVHIGMHWFLPVFFLIVGVKLVLAVDDINTDVCYRGNPKLPDPWLAVAGLAGFLSGRGLSWLGNRADPDEAEQRKHTPGSRVFGQFALAVAFLLLVPLWIIEAKGTVHVPLEQTTLEPITYYIRCAILNDKAASDVGVSSLFIIFVVCLAVGHWLWGYHERTDERLSGLGVEHKDVDRSAV